MVAVTYGVTRVPAAEAAERTEADESLFTRFMTALMESRLQYARREIARHAHLMPHDRDGRGDLSINFDLDEVPPGGRKA